MKPIDITINNLCKCIEMTNKEKINLWGGNDELANKLHQQVIYINETIERLRKISSQFSFIEW